MGVTARSRRRLASRQSTLASSSGPSGSAISPSDPDNGSNSARLPACHPRTGSSSRTAIRATSHGMQAPMSRNGRRSASTLPGTSASPVRASHAVIPGRSEYAQARWRPSCQ